MGNVKSTLQVASADASINGLYAHIPLNVDGAYVTFGAKSQATVFSFSNETNSIPAYVDEPNGKEYLTYVDTTALHEPVRFYTTDGVPSTYKSLQCSGRVDGSKQFNCSSTVDSKKLNKFYVCTKSGAANRGRLQIGTDVVSGCSGITLTYTPSK